LIGIVHPMKGGCVYMQLAANTKQCPQPGIEPDASISFQASQVCGASQAHLPLGCTTAKKGFAGSCLFAERMGQAAGLHTVRPCATSAPGQHVSPASPSGQAYRIAWTLVATPSTLRSTSTVPFVAPALTGAAVHRVSNTLAPAVGASTPKARCRLERSMSSCGGFQPGPSSQYQYCEPGRFIGSHGHLFVWPLTPPSHATLSQLWHAQTVAFATGKSGCGGAPCAYSHPS